MACGLLAEDCIIEHWCTTLDGARRERAGWRADCPVCQSARRLSIQIRGPRPAWNCHCGCDRATVRSRLAEMLPGCVSAKYQPRHAIDRDDLVSLAEDRALPELALRVAMLGLAGIGVPDACDRLGASRAQRYRIVSQLRHHTRS